MEGVQVADVELAGPLVSDQDAGLLCFVVCMCQNALMEAGIPLDLSLGSGNERLQADFEEFRLPDVNGDNMISRKEVREQAGRGGEQGKSLSIRFRRSRISGLAEGEARTEGEQLSVEAGSRGRGQ